MYVCVAVGYLGNVCVFGCYCLNLALSSNLVNSNHFLFSLDIFSSSKSKKKKNHSQLNTGKAGAAGDDFLADER